MDHTHDNHARLGVDTYDALGGQSEHPQAQQDDGWTWAIVEIFGHRSHAGRVREEEKFGAKMLRVDEPVYVGKQEGESWPRKIVDLRIDRWETHYYGGSSVFSFTPTDEATVMKIAERKAKIDPPANFQLSDQRDIGDGADHDEGDDAED